MITVYATQNTVESDSFNNKYDEDTTYATPVTTADELTAAVTEGKIGDAKLDITHSRLFVVDVRSNYPGRTEDFDVVNNTSYTVVEYEG